MSSVLNTSNRVLYFFEPCLYTFNESHECHTGSLSHLETMVVCHQSKIKVKVEVFDEDPANGQDHMDNLAKVLENFAVSPTAEASVYETYVMSHRTTWVVWNYYLWLSFGLILIWKTGSRMTRSSKALRETFDGGSSLRFHDIGKRQRPVSPRDSLPHPAYTPWLN